MRERGKFVAMLLCVCCCVAYVFGGAVSSVYGDEGAGLSETRTDPRDVYLDMEGLCGAEGLPYEYMTPKAMHVKTKIDPRDIYLDMEAMCGAEGLPYRYMIIPEEYVRVKHDPQDLKLDLEKMLTDDPSFVKGQEGY